ncbi:hypothetical protein TIFTF001_000225 [Ficus carica]|uniref:Uncharacterized protein n=1 Tax=Ficus carica TaxID=3494 RepID=A0AA88CNS0_FICCA|nr:hypothetical protein TIFTF001_000225 [Ficus carica]
MLRRQWNCDPAAVAFSREAGLEHAIGDETVRPRPRASRYASMGKALDSHSELLIRARSSRACP